MPLLKSKNKSAIGKNIKALLETPKPPKPKKTPAPMQETY